MTTENHGVGVGGVDGSNKDRGSQYRPNTSRDAERTEGTAKTPTTIAEVVEHPGSSTVSARTDPVGAETDPDGIINTRTAEAESAAAAAAFAAVAAAAAVRAKSMGGPSDEDSTFPPSPLPEAERHYAELLRGLGGVGEGFNVNVNGDVYADFDAGAIDGSLVGSGDIDRDKPLLYAIELSVAPPSEGGQPLSLLAEASCCGSGTARGSNKTLGKTIQNSCCYGLQRAAAVVHVKSTFKYEGRVCSSWPQLQPPSCVRVTPTML